METGILNVYEIRILQLDLQRWRVYTIVDVSIKAATAALFEKFPKEETTSFNLEIRKIDTSKKSANLTKFSGGW